MINKKFILVGRVTGIKQNAFQDHVKIDKIKYYVDLAYHRQLEGGFVLSNVT